MSDGTRLFLYADLADALTPAAEGWLDEAAEILDLGLATAESPGLVDSYRYAFVVLREMHPEFATRSRDLIDTPTFEADWGLLGQGAD